MSKLLMRQSFSGIVLFAEACESRSQWLIIGDWLIVVPPSVLRSFVRSVVFVERDFGRAGVIILEITVASRSAHVPGVTRIWDRRDEINVSIFYKTRKLTDRRLDLKNYHALLSNFQVMPSVDILFFFQACKFYVKVTKLMFPEMNGFHYQSIIANIAWISIIWS